MPSVVPTQLDGFETVQPGYLNANSRSRLTMGMLVMTVGLIIVQQVIPVGMAVSQAIENASFGGPQKPIYTTGVIWKNAYWFISADALQSNVRLMRKPVDSAEPPVQVHSLNFMPEELLPGPDQLWLVSEDTVAQLFDEVQEPLILRPPSPSSTGLEFHSAGGRLFAIGLPDGPNTNSPFPTGMFPTSSAQDEVSPDVAMPASAMTPAEALAQPPLVVTPQTAPPAVLDEPDAPVSALAPANELSPSLLGESVATTSGWTLYEFRNGSWERVAAISELFPMDILAVQFAHLGVTAEQFGHLGVNVDAGDLHNFQVLQYRDQAFVLARTGSVALAMPVPAPGSLPDAADRLAEAIGIPGPVPNGTIVWQNDQWRVVGLNEASLFEAEDSSDQTKAAHDQSMVPLADVALHTLQEGKWVTMQRSPESAVGSTTVLAGDAPDAVYWFVYNPLSNHVVYEVHPDRQTARVEVKGEFSTEFSRVWKQTVLSWILGLSCFIVLITGTNWLMHHTRVAQVEHARQHVQLASVARRAGARVIDSILMYIPTIIGGLLVWQQLDLEQLVRDFQDNPATLITNWLIPFLILLTVLVCYSGFLLLLWGAMTGWGGWTPGKLVMGIRVCRSSLGKPGLFRGLVRELLLMVDGFFNFLVGTLLIAFTVKWQRVGDLAADTIVVDARSLAVAREELARR